MKAIPILPVCALLMISCDRPGNVESTDGKELKLKHQPTPFGGSWLYEGFEFTNGDVAEATGCRIELEIDGRQVEVIYSKVRESAKFHDTIFPFINDDDLHKESVSYRGVIKKIKLTDDGYTEVESTKPDTGVDGDMFNDDEIYIIEGFPRVEEFQEFKGLYVRFSNYTHPKSEEPRKLLLGFQDPSWSFTRISK